MFVDKVTVQLHAGKGGNGCISFRREKYIPKGGPAGGDGGKGGSIIFEVDSNIPALDWFRHTRIIKAENGVPGAGACRNGRSGEDLTVKVPPGTLIRNKATGEIIFDGVEDKSQFLICKGGKGGKGNFRFRSPTNQAPVIATPGEEGESCEVELELKLIAEVGLVGFPNAGKSTIISQLSKHAFKTAPYPFTTLVPNLGYVYYKGGHRILFADIPGIIEGAHQNRGLGLEFLRHIERTKVLVYVLDASGIDGRTAVDDFKVLRHELASYDPELLNRPSVIVLNKADIESSQEGIEEFSKEFPELKASTFITAAEEGTGLDELKASIFDRVFAI